MAELTPINLRDANQRFSELVARVEAGEGFLLLKRGRPVGRLVPLEPGGDHLTPEQRAGLAQFLAEPLPELGIGKLDREDAYADRLERYVP
jgi:prevent-host-death family protein